VRLFDLGEEIREGWPVSVDMKRKKFFLDLGRDPKRPEVGLDLRFGTGLSSLFFDMRPPPTEEEVEGLVLERGALMNDALGFCLVRERRPDTDALVRVAIAPGVGGHIQYHFKHENIWTVVSSIMGEPEAPYPVHLVWMQKDSSFELERDGDLDGAPMCMRISWDGENMHLEN